jgi:prevent-host-death family protein
MTSYTATKAKADFDKLIERVEKSGELARITKGRKTIAVVVPNADYELIKRIREREDAEDKKSAKAALARYRKTGRAIPLARIAKENGLP